VAPMSLENDIERVLFSEVETNPRSTGSPPRSHGCIRAASSHRLGC